MRDHAEISNKIDLRHRYSGARYSAKSVGSVRSGCMGMRLVSIGLAAGLATLAVRSDTNAQPAPGAPSSADFARAKQLYDTATSELDKGAYKDAVRDFGAAYEITKDPVLFYKIALANEKAGACSTALVYYGRYVREAKPAVQFLERTRERVEACHGDWKALVGDTSGAGSAGSAAPTAGSASSTTPTGSGTTSGSGASTGSDGTAGSNRTSGSDAGSASTDASAGSGADALTGLGSGSAAPVVEHRHGRDLPWLMVGGALAFATAGAVLAYSATSSEQDIRDLYVGLDNKPPVFDAATQKRYQDLLDEGHRYQYLSWGAFGVAAGFGIAATMLFIYDHNEEQRRLILTPTATPQSAGVSATVRF
jgi:hypothetical protein